MMEKKWDDNEYGDERKGFLYTCPKLIDICIHELQKMMPRKKGIP